MRTSMESLPWVLCVCVCGGGGAQVREHVLCEMGARIDYKQESCSSMCSTPNDLLMRLSLTIQILRVKIVYSKNSVYDHLPPATNPSLRPVFLSPDWRECSIEQLSITANSILRPGRISPLSGRTKEFLLYLSFQNMYMCIHARARHCCLNNTISHATDILLNYDMYM